MCEIQQWWLSNWQDPLPRYLQKPTQLFALVNKRRTCFYMLENESIPTKTEEIAFPKFQLPPLMATPTQWLPLPLWKCTGLYGRPPPFQEQRHRCILRQSLWRKPTNTQQWQLLLMPEEMIKMDSTNKPTVRPTTNITQTNISKNS